VNATGSTTARRVRHAQLHVVAERLRQEYAAAPSIVVLRAVAQARRELMVAGVVLAPVDLVGARARGMLQPWAPGS
jgi:hypothetical protein